VKPLAIDLYCGLGGWTEGLLAEGYDVVGFDIERHVYGDQRYPAQLVVQDALTIHGSQFRDAALIVASPPCQEYSYMAMPWSLAKAKRDEYRAGIRDVKQLTALFDACFRIQREAIEAAGHFIPLVVENVRGAQEWVGRSRWNYGSFHLWGDVPALMPMVVKRNGTKSGRPAGEGVMAWTTGHVEGYWKGSVGTINGSGKHREQSSWDHGTKRPGMNWRGSDKPGYKAQAFNDTAIKNTGGSWFNVAHNTTIGKGNNPARGHGIDGIKMQGKANGRSVFPHEYADGIKQGGDWFNADQPSICRRTSSGSKARKAASAMIAKIPLPLSRHIAASWRP